jgi:hypothetical protein
MLNYEIKRKSHDWRSYQVNFTGNSEQVEKLKSQVILHRLCQSAIKVTRGKENIPKVAVIEFEKESRNLFDFKLTYKGIHLEDYKEGERHKYLHALSKGNRSVGPARLLDLKAKETEEITEKIKNGIEKIKDPLKDFLKIEEALKQIDWEKISQDLTEQTKNEKSVLLTISIDGKLPGEIDEFCKKFTEKRVLEGDRAKQKGEGNCAICKSKAEVQSAVPFDFFTVEKEGFGPMGVKSAFWKYAPLCKGCAELLYVSDSYLQENLSTRIAGKNAYLVPDLEPNSSEIEGSFIHFLWEWRERHKNKIAPEDNFPEIEDTEISEADPDKEEGSLETERSSPENSEALFPNLFEGLVDESDKKFKENPPFRSASLVFYEPGQKFMFLYTISEVLPENLKKTKTRLARIRRLLRQGVFGTNGEEIAKKIRADFEFISYAWKWHRKGQNESQGEMKLTPMHLVETILTNRMPPKEHQFWLDVDKILRSLYLEAIQGKKQKSEDKSQRLQSKIAEKVKLIWILWTLIYRFRELEGDDFMSALTKQTDSLKTGSFDGFWEDFFKPRMLLNTPQKRAMFLIGVLFGRVEDRQREERESKSGEMPIVNRLRGLAISYEEIKNKLFPELQLKLRQFDANTRAIQKIQEAAADFLSIGGDLTDEEARFCFCVGWALWWETIKAINKTFKSSEEDQEETLTEEEHQEEKTLPNEED